MQCVTPPSPPSGVVGSGGSTAHNYAIHQLYLGDTDRTGISNADAWRSFGYNLDDRVTVVSSTDVCTLAAGAARSTQIDGNGGIDNSFGENLLPIFLTIAGTDFSPKVNASIQGGGFTDLVYTVGFDDASGNTTTAKNLSGVLLGGGSYASLHDGGTPAWNLGTHWPIRPESLNGCPNGECPVGTDPIASAAAQFPSAYQKNGTFVSGSPSNLVLYLPLGAGSLTLDVQSGVVTFGPDVPGSVTDGTIAGAIPTTQLVAAFQAVAGSISTSLCSGSAFQSIVQQIEQDSDIVVDPGTGAISNPAGTACNAISIGLGFDATEIAAPVSSDITGPTPVPDFCEGPDG